VEIPDAVQPLPTVSAGPARRIAVAALPLAALALVVLLDAVIDATHPPVPVLGLLDESAHLATSWIVLAAFLPGPARRLLPWALVGSVVTDLDHVPLYLWHALAAAPGARPVTHSLLTVAVLAVAGVAVGTRSRLRAPLLGLALGVALHLVRDLGTGPGVPLLWPAGPAELTVPYAGYLLPLAVVALMATVRRRLPTSVR
jgi:inner membrane protein